MRQHQYKGVTLITGILTIVGSADKTDGIWETLVVEVDGQRILDGYKARPIKYSQLIKEYLEPGDVDGLVMINSEIVAVRVRNKIVFDEERVPTEHQSFMSWLFLGIITLGLGFLFFSQDNAGERKKAVREAIEYLETTPLGAETA